MKAPRSVRCAIRSEAGAIAAACSAAAASRPKLEAMYVLPLRRSASFVRTKAMPGNAVACRARECRWAAGTLMADDAR
jgi:hypothetical protein